MPDQPDMITIAFDLACILLFVIEDARPARYDYKCLRIPVSLAKATTLIVTAVAGRSLLQHETLKR